MAPEALLKTRRETVQYLLTAAAAATVAAGVVKADQPHMEAAMSSLQTALKELQEATADKGGHRGTAIKLIKQAIVETQAGIDWAKAH
jgi:hypothetical protein